MCFSYHFLNTYCELKYSNQKTLSLYYLIHSSQQPNEISILKIVYTYYTVKCTDLKCTVRYILTHVYSYVTHNTVKIQTIFYHHRE